MQDQDQTITAEKDLLIEKLTADLNELQVKHGEVLTDNETLLAVNKELTLQVEELSNQALQPTVKPQLKATSGFTRNGKNYTFNFLRVVLKGGRKITTAEVMADEALQDELIESKSTMIREEA